MARNSSHHARDFLAYLLPKEALNQLRELALAYERDRAIRAYFLKRAWLILPVGFLFLINTGACIFGGVILWRQFFVVPAPVWLQWVALIGCALTFMGMMMAQLCLLFVWLGKRASRTIDPAADSDLDRMTLRKNGNEFLLAFCVVVSIGIVALASPELAAVLAVIAIVAPVILTIFDRR